MVFGVAAARGASTERVAPSGEMLSLIEPIDAPLTRRNSPIVVERQRAIGIDGVGLGGIIDNRLDVREVVPSTGGGPP